MKPVISYRLHFPSEVTAEAVAGMLRALAAEPRGGFLSPPAPLVFETVLLPELVSWWLEVPTARLPGLRTALQRELPGVRLEVAARQAVLPVRAAELRVRSRERLLAVELAPPAVSHLLGIAGQLRPGEVVLVQWQIGAWLPRSPIPPATKPLPRTIWNLPDWGRPVRNTEEVTAARAKQAEHIFGGVGRVAVAAASGGRARQLVARSVGAYQLLRAPGVGVSRRWLPSWLVIRRITYRRVSQLDPVARLSASELAGIIGWPVGNPLLPGVRYQTSRLLAFDPRVVIPAQLHPGDRVLGRATGPSQEHQVPVLRARDGLRHCHVIGPTGVGKSTLLARLVLADIAAGRGTVVIDPKGDLVTDIVARVPREHRRQVVVLDPGDAAPVGLNPVAAGAVGVDGVLHVLRSVWRDFWGPRLGDILHAGLLTLAGDREAHSLSELPLLLGDSAFRRPLVARAVKRDRLGLGTFWPWFDSLSDDARAAALAPVMNKLRGLLMRPELRAVLGQAEPRFDLRSIFTERQCLLVRLPKGQLGSEGAQLLGSLLMAQLWRLTLQRSAVPADRRHPVTFYLDEFQEFLRLNLDLSDALVQARGLGVGLVLAHQHLDQMDRVTRSTVLANAGSRITFRLGAEDAAVIAKGSGGRLSPEDLQGLAAFEAYASLSHEAEPTPYGSLATLPLQPAHGSTDALLRDVRRRWGIPALETEERLERLIDGGTHADQLAPLGGRRVAPGSSGGHQ